MTGLASASDLNVVTSIRPLHSLVANVTDGVLTPTNIVPANASPHHYSLKPSDAQALQNADIIFWVGDNLESFLAKSITSLPQTAKVIALQDHQDHFHFLPTREVSLDDHRRDEHNHTEHEDHGHEHEHGHDDHDHKDDHAHGEEHSHDDEAHGNDDHGHEEQGHNHGNTDLHMWLDVENAKHFVELVAEELSAADAANAVQYQENAAKTLAQLDALNAEIKAQLAGLEDKKFVTFHDAYQYFETQYGLSNAGTVTLSPDVKPGAKRLTKLKAHLKEDQISCIFAEPQFDAKLVDLAVEGTDVKQAVLDPLGADLADGADLYFELIRTMGNNFADCLSE
ncbi:zinc ABC transporter substrate-binding protein [Maritalea sp. P4.10X]|uniref:High-affinity zinc uptake system protein ZnuA n=2 Tax=Maritalea mediterranea TaxID=2909667 RepID=A0ABS9E9B4_9HYPH|nr:zinc ABC transporter substrate-binding protein [Maritalea mediterranea]